MHLLFCILIMVVVTQNYIMLKFIEWDIIKRKTEIVYDNKKTQQVSLACKHQGYGQFQADDQSI